MTAGPIDAHLDDLVERQPRLAGCRSEIAAGFELLRGVFANGGRLLLCGNGGSAADAEHWAGELLKGFESTRPLPAAERTRVPAHLADRLQGGLAAIPLTGFTSLRSAMANDVDAAVEFAQLVWALGRPGDAVAVISTSGRSPNVRHAAEVARARGVAVLALTGSAGGPLAELADVAIRVPAERTLEVQELHLPVYHTLSVMLETAFFPPSASA